MIKLLLLLMPNIAFGYGLVSVSAGSNEKQQVYQSLIKGNPAHRAGRMSSIRISITGDINVNI